MRYFPLILFFSFLQTAATYHVATTGNNSNSGADLGNAWATPQKCADTMIAGDICKIHAGTYGAAYTPLTITTGGNSENPITYTNAGDGEVILQGIHHIISSGATWTVVGGGATNQWKSPTIATIGTIQGVQRLSDKWWYAKTVFSNNVDAHAGSEPNSPWWHYAGSNYIEVYLATDPTNDNWLVTEQTHVISISNSADFINIDGFTIERGYSGVSASAGSDNIRVTNCHVRDNAIRGLISIGETATPSRNFYAGNNIIEYSGEHGIKSGANNCPTSCPLEQGSFDGIVENNIIRNNGYHGVQMSVAARGWIVRNNILQNNGVNPCGRIASSSEGCATSTAAINDNYSDSIILNNIILSHDELRHDIGIGYGIFAWENDETLRIEKNMISDVIHGIKVYDNSDGVTYPLNQTDLRIFNNIIFDTDLDAYQLQTTGIQFYNNTADNCGTVACLKITARAQNLQAKNNALVASAGQIVLSVDSGATYTSDNNAFYSDYATPFSYNGSEYSFANYKSTSSQDANSIFANFTTDFVNYSANNFAITSSSNNLKDAGAVIALVPFDYRGKPRPQGSGYSMGAYEEGTVLKIT